MIYAKCIFKKQIAKSEEEFVTRQKGEEHTVYLEGAEVKGNLSCVPLNCIFQCLSYGDSMAIISQSDEIKKNKNYITEYKINAVPVKYQIDSNKQKIEKILHLTKKETIDFILNEVGDSKKIELMCGLEDYIGKETFDYLCSKLKMI